MALIPALTKISWIRLGWAKFNLGLSPRVKDKAPPGFEPGAAALQVQRSTAEL